MREQKWNKEAGERKGREKEQIKRIQEWNSSGRKIKTERKRRKGTKEK